MDEEKIPAYNKLFTILVGHRQGFVQNPGTAKIRVYAEYFLLVLSATLYFT